MSELSVADTLDRAADVIEERGWCRNAFVDDSGHVCTHQALFLAGEPFETAQAFRRAIGEASITHWNDQVALDQADVVNHLRKVSEMARAEAAGGATQ
jgi:hypothetical protein